MGPREIQGLLGLVVAFKDLSNKVVHLFAQSCGHTSNNLMELLALEKGLLIAIQGDFFPYPGRGRLTYGD